MNHTLRVRSFRRVPQAFVLSILFPLGLMADPPLINFYGIGDLTGGDVYSQVRDATRDNNGNIVAVGGSSRYSTSTGFPVGDTPVKWVQGAGLSVLPQTGSSANPFYFVAGRVISIFSDGSSLIGGSSHNTNDDSNGAREPALWNTSNTGTTSVTGLGYLNGAPRGNGAINGLSANGTVAYGFDAYISTVGGMQAFRYAGGSAVELGFLSGDDSSSPATHAVSTDGTVMVGSSYNSAVSGGFGPGTKAFRYNSTGGTMTALSLLSNGGLWSFALAMTPDGNKTIGVANSSDFLGGQLVSWDSAGAVTALGSPSSDPTFGFSNLGGVSPDGSVVVVSGALSADANFHAYFYNTYGWFDFQTAMTLAGVNLSGWTLTDVLGMSADGTLVYGDGLHNGVTEGFVLSLPSDYLASVTAIPEPSTCAMLMGAAGLAVVVWRRRKSAIR